MKNTTPYLEIKPEFYSRGFNHRLVKRHGMIALFERWHRETNGPHHFEVVRLKNSPSYEIAGKTIPASETYPPSESWGTHGFTYSTREPAEAKFNELA